MRLPILITALVAGALVAAATPARAACGLGGCPLLPGPSAVAPAPTVVLGAATRAARFDLDGVSGHYLLTTLRAELSPWPWLVVGAFQSVAWLSAEGRSATGLGNLVPFAEAGRSFGPVRLAGGVQLELPVGDHDSGIADDHFDLLPYLRADLRSGAGVFGFGQLGLRHAPVGDHVHVHDDGSSHVHAVPVLVAPHARTELVHRAGLGWASPDEELRLMGVFEGQAVLDGAPDGVFLTAGAEAWVRLGSGVQLGLSGELPLTTARRFEARTGLELRWAL